MSSSSKSLSSSSACSSAHFGAVGRRPRARFIRDKTNYFSNEEDRKTSLTETQTRAFIKRGTEEEEEEEDCCCSTSGRSFSGSKMIFSAVMSAFLALNNDANASTILSSSYSLGEAETTKEQLFSTNAEERRRKMFEIATSSYSSEEQDNAVANNNNNNNNINNANDENKPELGQGFFKDLEIFIEREPPIAVGFLFLFLINGVWGVIFTLSIRETNAGPGGEFGKGLAALRKEIVKGIFKFFGGALGRFTK